VCRFGEQNNMVELHAGVIALQIGAPAAVTFVRTL
jgi:hypothetical protein